MPSPSPGCLTTCKDTSAHQRGHRDRDRKERLPLLSPSFAHLKGATSFFDPKCNFLQRKAATEAIRNWLHALKKLPTCERCVQFNALDFQTKCFRFALKRQCWCTCITGLAEPGDSWGVWTTPLIPIQKGESHQWSLLLHCYWFLRPVWSLTEHMTHIQWQR